MHAAISVPTPCPGEASSTWITPACVNACSTCLLLYAATPVFLASQLPQPHHHGGTPKALHHSASPCKTSLLLPKGSIPSSLRLSTHLISQLHAPLCALWAYRCPPHVFTSLHTYPATPTCEYLHVADLAYLVLFHSVPLHVFLTLKALLSPAKLLRLHRLLNITVFFPSGVL